MNSLELALKLEDEGFRYYTEQADKNKGNSLGEVFRMLADDEETHKKILENQNDIAGYKVEDGTSLEKAQELIKKFTAGRKVLESIPGMPDLYREAIEIETRSIEVYQALHDNAKDENSKLVYKSLVHQEKDHKAIVEEIVLHVNRPGDYVESPEFGETKTEY